MSRYFTVAQAADHMQVGQDAIRDAIREGELEAKRFGKGPRAPFRITGDALDAWYTSWADA